MEWEINDPGQFKAFTRLSCLPSPRMRQLNPVRPGFEITNDYCRRKSNERIGRSCHFQMDSPFGHLKTHRKALNV